MREDLGENAPRVISELANKVVKYIEAGDASSACITYEPAVYVWGSGQNGRLGNGQQQNNPVPMLSSELEDKVVEKIVMGTNSTFAILGSGRVFAFGSSKSGKLGFELANDKNYVLPKEIISLGPGAEDVSVAQVAAGPFHSLVLTTEGVLYAMGNSKDGKLGIESAAAAI